VCLRLLALLISEKVRLSAVCCLLSSACAYWPDQNQKRCVCMCVCVCVPAPIGPIKIRKGETDGNDGKGDAGDDDDDDDDHYGGDNG
jgi:hypothetical protein